MVNRLAVVGLFRFGLPLVLLSAVVFRYNVFSFVYLFLLLLGPLLSGPSRYRPLSRKTRLYLAITVTLSAFFCIAHIVYQIYLAATHGYSTDVPTCGLQERLMVLFGLYRLNKISIINALRLVAIDFFVLAYSCLVLVLCGKLNLQYRERAARSENNAGNSAAGVAGVTTIASGDCSAPASGAGDSSSPGTRMRRNRATGFLLLVGEFLYLVSMAAAGVIHASLLSLVYFLTFISVATWLGLSRPLGPGYRGTRVVLILYSAFHFIVLYIYQFDYSQQFLPGDSLEARLIGLTALRKPLCNETGVDIPSIDITTLSFHDLHWTYFISPLAILVFYFMASTMARYTTFSVMVPQTGDRGTKRPSSASPMPFSSPIESKRSSTKSGNFGARRRRQDRLSDTKVLTPARRQDSEADASKPLLESEQIPKSYDSVNASPTRQTQASHGGLTIDRHGSGVWGSTEDVNSGAAMAVTPHGVDEPPTLLSSGGADTSRFRQMGELFKHAGRFVYKGSYVITLIIMMAWSITYHSWLTFVLLLWSCLLWMMPNSRLACLRASPFLVFYAETLLLLQYIYSLDLTEQELPQNITNVNLNLAQIGLVKFGDDSCEALTVKILYSFMFWVTLKQYVDYNAEVRRARQDAQLTLEHVQGSERPEALRQMSVSTTLAGTNVWIRRLGTLTRRFFVQYWIWVVAIMLMTISLGGEKVVLYRIAYMFLFLFFILMFQFSYRQWIRFMYGFLLTVIIYSMLVLVLIYTYQFESFPDYWEKYLGIPLYIQEDIGLEIYSSDRGTLFLKLLIPTLFVIVTIIQLHYFHREFIRLNMDYYATESAPYRSPPTSVDLLSSRVGSVSQKMPTDGAAEGVGETVVDIETAPNSPKRVFGSETSGSPEPATPATVISRDKIGAGSPTGDMIAGSPAISPTKKSKRSSLTLALQMERAKQVLQQISKVLWRVLEIHIAKIIFFAVFLLSTHDVCAVHFIFVILVVLGLPLVRFRLYIIHCCSLWASVLLVSKMIYQLKFVEAFGWSTHCSYVWGLSADNSTWPKPFNSTIDNREWIGFRKDSNLINYCKGYISLIAVFTMQAVIKIHQNFSRHEAGEMEPPPGIVFPEVTRKMADENILSCLRYLVNFFFYKFGVEFCFVTMVACIGTRLDVFSVITAIWLSIMFLMRRRTLSRVWIFYIVYLGISIPIQYILAVGLPAGLCIEYPWYQESGRLHETAQWLFLPDFINPPLAIKILVDFFQLLFACCQLAVFNIEGQSDADDYIGGSNAELYDSKGVFVGRRPNPVPDFISVRSYKSYLWTIERCAMMGFFWITLAIMFLAGINRVSLFAMGYVLGCFFFLWTGTEFYLKPMGVLLRMWNFLIVYNVVVIFIKSILQLIGCVYLESLAKSACWLIQLLGIACLKKLQGVAGRKIMGAKNTIDDCQVPTDEAGLLWDGICFAFLLLQRRLFGSYYFHHIIIEMLAQQELASRGAEVIHEMQMKEVQEQAQHELEVMDKIKMKMDKIRENQQKHREGEFIEPETHYQAIRSGDYYLFEDMDETDVDLDMLAAKKSGADDEDTDVKTKGLNAVLSQMMKSGNLKSAADLEGVTRKVASEEDTREVGESSGMSPIVSIDRSSPHSSQQPPIASSSSPSQPSTTVPQSPTAVPGQQEGLRQRRKTKGAIKPLDAGTTVEVHEDELDAGPEEPVQPKESLWERVCNLYRVCMALLDSMLISATAKLNNLSGAYRDVAELLDKEKRHLKKRYTDGLAILTEDNQYGRPATPIGGPFALRSDASSRGSLATTVKHSKDSTLPRMSADMLATPEDDEDDVRRQPYIVQFADAVLYAIMSRTEVLCYMMIVVNQIKTASLLSLPLPLMAFLWGSLSVPRPSKTFWITIITYTEAIVVVKYLFQFDFFYWNRDVAINAKKPFWPPRLIGIDKRTDNNDYALYDLLLLLLVFFHRFMLKSLGLWKDTDRLEGSSTDLSKQDSPRVPLAIEAAPPVAAIEDAKSCATAPVEGAEQPQEDAAGEVVEDIELLVDESATNITKILEGIRHYLMPFYTFFSQLLDPPYRVTTDVYAWMFLCDFINFFIMVFGYWAFGTGAQEDNFTAVFQKNEVPIPFLIMLLAQFALIVIDRALYLRKHIFGKLIFQIIIVFVIHIWMFFVLPALSQVSFVEDQNLPPKMWYVIKCIYLILSAYQIRAGYPTRILGNFFTKKYNYVNYFCFKGYMLVPFLYELRCLMDWIWTDTSMVLNNWLKMEDIYANIFMLKCIRRAEEEYPTPRGVKRSALVKYGMGGTLLFVIILIIWFPLLLFSLGNTVGRHLTPDEFQVGLSIGGFEPLLTITGHRGKFEQFSGEDYTRLQRRFKSSSSAMSFLANYDPQDIIQIDLKGYSDITWRITPPSLDDLQKELVRNRTDDKEELKLPELDVRLTYKFTRNTGQTSADSVIAADRSRTLTHQQRSNLAKIMMADDDRNHTVEIESLFPKFLIVPRTGNAEIAKSLVQKDPNAPDDEYNKAYNTVSVLLDRTQENSSFPASMWWQMHNFCNESDSSNDLLSGNCSTNLRVIVFNDKVFPKELSIFSTYGIVGLYTTFVLVASRILRGFMAGMSTRIIFEDMPNVDRVLQLCHDIYLVRESRDLALEEDLFAKLLFLYRSPETLIKWTRMPPPERPPRQQQEQQQQQGAAAAHH